MTDPNPSAPPPSYEEAVSGGAGQTPGQPPPEGYKLDGYAAPYPPASQPYPPASQPYPPQQGYPYGAPAQGQPYPAQAPYPSAPGQGQPYPVQAQAYPAQGQGYPYQGPYGQPTTYPTATVQNNSAWVQQQRKKRLLFLFVFIIFVIIFIIFVTNIVF